MAYLPEIVSPLFTDPPRSRYRSSWSDRRGDETEREALLNGPFFAAATKGFRIILTAVDVEGDGEAPRHYWVGNNTTTRMQYLSCFPTHIPNDVG